MTKITIQTDADFTPKGKRTYRAVCLSGSAVSTHIRWYVSGRIYRTLPLNVENFELSKQWVKVARITEAKGN
jgi:hypothetical protein